MLVSVCVSVCVNLFLSVELVASDFAFISVPVATVLMVVIIEIF